MSSFQSKPQSGAASTAEGVHIESLDASLTEERAAPQQRRRYTPCHGSFLPAQRPAWQLLACGREKVCGILRARVQMGYLTCAARSPRATAGLDGQLRSWAGRCIAIQKGVGPTHEGTRGQCLARALPGLSKRQDSVWVDHPGRQQAAEGTECRWIVLWKEAGPTNGACQEAEAKDAGRFDGVCLARYSKVVDGFAVEVRDACLRPQAEPVPLVTSRA